MKRCGNFPHLFLCLFSELAAVNFSPLHAKDSGCFPLSDLKEVFPADLTECFPLPYNISLTLKNLKERNR